MFPVSSVARKMVMVIYSGNVRFLLWCMLGNFLSFSPSCLWIGENDLVVFYGIAGYLVLVVLVGGTHGLL